MNINIRRESIADYDAVDDVVTLAFATAEHTDGNEQNLINALRQSDAFVPELSLVAEIGDKIVGHILFTKVMIAGTTQLALAPLAVSPEYQNRGIGHALVREGHDVAKKLGYNYSVLLGNPTYYGRLGYRPAHTFGISAPFDVPAENFMAHCLIPLQLKGVVEYPKEFGI